MAGTGTRHPLPSSGTMTRGLLGPPLPPVGLLPVMGGPCGTAIARAGNSSSSGGTSSSDGTAIECPCGTGTSSSSGGTTIVLSCDSETSSSTTRMRFVLGTSTASYITCITNWSVETGSSQRRRRQRLDSLDEAMASI
jgi:hypothetical protein